MRATHPPRSLPSSHHARSTGSAQSLSCASTRSRFGSRALRAVMAECVAAGLPDLRGARFFIGRLVVTRRIAPELPVSSMAAVQTRQSFVGLHARLADGSWLVRMAQHLRCDATMRIDSEETVSVAGDDLPRLAAEHVEWFPGERNDPLDGYHWRDRDSIRSSLALAAIPLLTGLGHDSVMALPIFLHGAGLSDSDRSTVLAAVTMAEHDQCAPPECYGAFEIDAHSVDDEFQPHSVAVRLMPMIAMVRGALAWLIAEGGAHGNAEPPTPQQVHARRNLIARLPWQAEQQRIERLCVQRGVLPGVVVACADVPVLASPFVTCAELVAAMSDQRICDWTDTDHVGRSVARTVGDAAFRRLVQALGSDPRPMIGIDPATPWNDAVRMHVQARLRVTSQVA